MLFILFSKTGYAEWRGPGVNGYLVARERYIDDTLKDALGDGLQQLVILGAGFDSRAYRVIGLKGRVKIFEVDHPATQADKLVKLKAIFGHVPDHVTYVPVDFNTQTLKQRLPECGYDPALKTLFIWQGVTMYLSPDAVDATLAFVVDDAGSGSTIVFDYLYRELLEGKRKQNEISGMRRYRFMTGEGLTFGMMEGAVEAFLQARGFREVKDVGADDLHRLYFTGKNASRKVVSGYGIAVGRV